MDSIPDSVEIEARAKITWGEPASQVLAFLAQNGVNEHASQALLADLLAEREREVRSVGFKKIWTGLLLTVPAIGFFLVSKATGFMPMKLFSVLLAIAAIGLWRSLSGLVIIQKPKSVTGDLSSPDV